MFRRSILAILLLTFALSPPLFSQVARFHHIAADDGLTQNTISSIVQDDMGNIWIGTYDGLNKYDGYKITQYPFSKDSNSISSSVIRSLYADKEHNLWISATGGGMCRLDLTTGKFTTYMVDSAGGNSIASNNINDIAEFEKGILYIASSKGLNLFDKKTGNFTLITHSDTDNNSLLATSVRAFTKDRNGHLWFGHTVTA